MAVAQPGGIGRLGTHEATRLPVTNRLAEREPLTAPQDHIIRDQGPTLPHS